MSEQQPSRTGGPATHLLHDLRDLLLEIWEIAVWGDVKAGGIDLRDATLSFQAAVRLARGAVIILACLLPFVGRMRSWGLLFPLPLVEGERIMPFVPLISVPLFYGLLALAWAYLLAGAFGTALPVRGLVLAFFGIFALGLLSPRELFFPQSRLMALVTWAALALVCVIVGVGPPLLRRKESAVAPATRLVAMFVLCGVLFLGSYATAVRAAGGSLEGVGGAAVRLEGNLSVLVALLAPFFLVAGGEVAGVAVDLGHAGTRWIQTHVGRRAWAVGLGLFLLFRLGRTWLSPFLAGEPLRVSGGAVGIVLLGLAAYVALHRWLALDNADEPAWTYFAPALLLIGPLPVFQTFVALASLATNFFPASTGLAERFGFFLATASALFLAVLQPYLLVVGGLLIALGVVASARAGWRMPRWALLFICLGSWVLLWRVTRPLGRLGRWTFESTDVTAVATTAVAVVFVLLAIRRRLTTGALKGLTVAAIMLWLLGTYDLLSDPLSPLAFLPRTGALFLALSLLFGVLEAGEYFALDEGSLALPRSSRVFLFLGYALLASLFAHWGALTNQAGFGEGYASTGFLLIGIPLALAALLRLPAG